MPTDDTAAPQLGWKLVRRGAHTSHYGAFVWPEPGQSVASHNPNMANRGPCPSRPRDGYCLARTVAGAQSGGARLRDSALALVSYRPADVLGQDTDKLRISAGTVIGYIEDAVAFAARPGANLRYANLRSADLSCADLSGANLAGAYLPPERLL